MHDRGHVAHAPNHGGPGVCNGAACNSARPCPEREVFSATGVARSHWSGVE